MFPLGDLDPVARLRTQANPYQSPYQRPTVQPLAPEEEQSLLGRIGGAALGGVGYVGDVLEKTFGGRAVRGLLGGRPRELLSIIPGSDLVGITDPSEKVTGKELLGYGKEDDSWGATLAGLGTEVLTDPGTYLTFGGSALTGAGKAAKAAGVLPKTVAGRASTTLSQALLGAAPEATEAATRTLARAGTSLAEQGGQHLGGVVGLGLPFMDPAVVLGANPGGARFVEGLSSAAKAADAAARSVPVLSNLTYAPVADTLAKGFDVAGRYGRALFDNSVLGAVTREGQAAAEQGSAAAAKVLAGHRDKMAGYAQRLKALGDPNLAGTGSDLRQILESTAGAVNPEVRSLAQEMRQHVSDVYDQLTGLGVKVNRWRDPLNPELEYFPRYSTKQAKGAGLFGPDSQPLRALDETLQSGRQDILQGFTGGSEAINRALNDPLVHQGSRQQAGQYVLQNYLTAPDPQAMARTLQVPLRVQQRGQQAVDQWVAAKVATAQKNQPRLAGKFVDYARQLRAAQDAKGIAGDVTLFGNHPLIDMSDYLEHAARLHGSAEAAQSLLASQARSLSGAPLAYGERTLFDALNEAGLRGAGAKQNLLGRLADRFGGPVQNLGDFAVGPDTIREIGRYMGGFRATEATNPALRAFDYATNLTKAMQTAIWPAFHARNLFSGGLQNLHEAGLEALGQGGNAARLIAGETVPGAARLIGSAGTDAEATAQIAREMYAHGVGGHMPNISREIVGPGGSTFAGRTLDDFLQRIPGENPRTVGGALRRAIDFGEEGSYNPLNVTGAGANADVFSPVAGGRQLGDVVEGVNRGSLYMTLRGQGYSAEEAAKRVLASHFDYTPSALTSFEKTWMRRLVPYYSFTRHNLPYQAQAMAQAPGSLPAITAKAAAAMRQGDSSFLPDYLGGGLAVPLGSEDQSGVRRYLTRLDTPAEQAFEWLQGGPRGTERTIMGLMGMTNPMIKGPLELATQRQFFTGRELPDLYSFTGSTLLDQAIMSSPLSRFFTTGRTLTDPAKWADPYAIPTNLLTGARVSDVDVAKFRNIAEREWVEENLRGLPAVSKFQTLSVKPGLEGTLTPEEWNLLRLNRTMELRAQQAKKRGQG